MPPSYKLSYFDGQGVAEPIRLILAYAKVQFKDVRVEHDKEWPAIKSQTPWGVLPILEEDGKQLSQSVAILRYLGNKFGLAPPTEWEVAKANEYIDALVDLRTAVYSATWPEPNAAKLKEIGEQQFPTTCGKFNTILKKSGGSGYLVGDKFTYADIFVAHVIQALADMLKVSDKLRGGEYPEVTRHIDRVMGQPGIKEWVANRKPSDF